jgi:Carboxypeptidase regulatory-like domain
MPSIWRVPLIVLASLCGGVPQLHGQVDSAIASQCQPDTSGGQLTGRVFREHDSAAVATALVRLRGTGCQVTTGPEGVFRFRGLPDGTYVLVVRAIGFSRSDSITATVAAGQVTTVGVPLLSAGDFGSPLPIDPTRVVACAERAYAVGAPPSTTDSLLIVALCIALGEEASHCVAWDDMHAPLLKRFQWHPGRPVRASACTEDTEDWVLRHPSGAEAVHVTAEVTEYTDSTATIEIGSVAHLLGGQGRKCPVTRTSAGWTPYRWCYRTWIS